MKLVKLNIEEFIESVDSINPTPGGGSVSALASSLGIALMRMVGHLTVGKKRFLKVPEEEQVLFVKTIEELVSIKRELIELIDEDTNAYNEIVNAYKLPKETNEEIALRKKKIQEGTINSINVPYKVSLISLNALEKMQIILKNGNPNTISDLGVSALSLSAGIQGAAMNVLINLPGLDDERLKKELYDSIKSLTSKTQKLTNEILDVVYNKLII